MQIQSASPGDGAFFTQPLVARGLTLRFAIINGLPGVIVDAPEGPVQTATFEVEGDVIGALYVVRNPDKLGHLAPASTLDEHSPQ